MKEIKQIIEAYDKAAQDGIDAVLTTVVHVEGSSYRRAGARMLVDENGEITGAISGGCLEGDSLRKALRALFKGENMLTTYDTSDENDAIIGAQLGCNGIIQVLFEPLTRESHSAIDRLREMVDTRSSKVLLTFFDLRAKDGIQIGTHLVVDASEITLPDNLSIIQPHVEEVAQKETSMFYEYENEGVTRNVFVEHCPPNFSLIIAGAGNDARPVSDMAQVLGWDVYVVDGRRTHATEERFGSASCQVIVSEPEKILAQVPTDKYSLFVLMTHNYNYDLALLKWLLRQEEIPYIGILGPAKRFGRMLDDLAKEGIELTEEQRTRIHAPVGLDMGAETSAEIALSALAEMMTVMRKKTGGFLKQKKGTIHSREHTDIKFI